MLQGKTFSKIDVSDDEIIFYINDKPAYKMYHEQDCCECVEVEDIVGDINDLINTEILSYSEDTNHGQVKDDDPWSDDDDDADEGDENRDVSATWTFYNFRTIKGSVTIRWYGSSNGYYSESVTLKEL